MSGFSNVGRNWTVDELKGYLDTIPSPAWGRAVCLHHTAAPSLAQRPLGLLPQHIENIRDYYIGKNWKAGPHLFADDSFLHGMTPLDRKGIHAVSFNGSAIGIEVLGDYDRECPVTSRGLHCWRNAAGAAAAILKWLGIGITEKTVLFHREDPQTDKTCPGQLVSKPWIMELIRQA